MFYPLCFASRGQGFEPPHVHQSSSNSSASSSFSSTVLSIPRLGLCNEWELLAAEHRLLRNGVEVSLQLKAFEILCVFVENAGRLLKKDDLLQQVWPDAVVDENNLNKCVSVTQSAG